MASPRVDPLVQGNVVMHEHGVTDISATGTPSGSTVLYGDGTWAEPPGASGGEANTAANVGSGGVGVYKTKSVVELQFKNINAGSSKVTVTDDTDNSEVDIDVDPGEIAISDLSVSGEADRGKFVKANGDTGALEFSTLAAVASSGSYSDLGDVPATFTPASHDNSAHSETYITASGVTYENLNANSDVGDGSSQVAAGDHTHSYEPANANIQSHISSTENPHSVTATQVGLGNVDNTSDADKPISDAVSTALGGKLSTDGGTVAGELVVSGDNGGLKFLADTDGGDFNIYHSESGTKTLAFYGSAGNVLNIDLLDGNLALSGGGTVDGVQVSTLGSDFSSHASSTSNPHSVTANQVLPDQTDNSGKFLTTDGSDTSWADASGGLTHQQIMARCLGV